MKYKKKVEILLKVIETVYTKNTGTNQWKNYAKKKVCHPNGYFLLFFPVGFIVMSYLNINFLCAKDSLFLVVIKKKIMWNFLMLGF